MDLLNRFNQEKTSYHTITTNHPYVSQLGLSQFTVDKLYSWWNKKEGDVYVNRKLIGGDKNTSSPENLILKANSQFVKVNNLTFKSWRKEAKGGKYRHFAIPYIDVNGHQNAAAASNLGEGFCEDIEPWSIKTAVSAGKYGSAPTAEYTFEDLNLQDYDNITVDPITGEHSDISGVYPITNIIAMNNAYVRLGEEINYGAGDYRPRSYFLDDIKSSKYGYLYFLNDVRFNLNINEGDFSCFKDDVVEYQLRLYDYKAPKKTGKSIALPGITLATDSVLSHGQVALNQEDGDADVPLHGDSPASKVAGELDLTYKPILGKFTSGTEQIIAMISQEVPACEYSAGAEDLQNMNIAEILNNPSSDLFFGIGSGLAIPINAQNGNPLQWAPSYKKAKGIRGEDLSKIEVKVFNPTPRGFAVNELVMLNKIDGVWVPIPIASGEQPGVTPGSISDWEFTYHMTNGVYFFRSGAKDGDSKLDPHTKGRDQFTKISPTEMETYFHQRYYKDDVNNKEPDDSYKGELAFTNDGYFQVTSFDFMGPQVGGMRSQDALKSTIWNLSADGTEIDNPEDGRGQDSAPFFGCVFPDGYSSSKIANYKKEDNNTFSAFPSGSPKMDLIDVQKYVKESYNLPAGPFQPEPLPEDFLTRPYDPDFQDIKYTRTNNTAAKGRSMFEEDDERLRHLPADIATNASPSGENGRPLSILGKIQSHVTGFGGSYFREGDPLQNSVHRYWSDHAVWLHVSGQPYESTYDFKPVNNQKIQFRPLTDAVFAANELGLSQQYHDIADRNTVGWLGSRSWFLFGYWDSPIQRDAYTRESVYANDLFGPQGYAPQYNYMINLDNNPELSSYNSNNYFNKDYWGIRNWTHPIGGGSFSNAKPGFGLGVIGAVCTATASNYINFSTTNYFGAPHYADVAIPTDRLPSFGGRAGREFDDLQTTCLSARVYQFWPREQTIYDPRFFAVHHFNPGTQLSGILEPWNENYELQETETVSVTYEGQTIEIEKDVSMTEVDIRQPSIIENGQVVGLDINYLIFNNGATQEFHVPPKEILEKEYWKIDPQRRAKLLPYKYNIKSIGIPFQGGDLGLSDSVAQGIVNLLAEGQTMKLTQLLSHQDISSSNIDSQFYIKSSGTGYTQNDIFTIDGGRGEGVVLNPFVNNDGAIQGFSVVSGGFDFASEDFPLSTFEVKKVPLGNGKYTNNLSEAASLKIVLDSQNDAASGFEGYILYGNISYISKEDYKPKVAIPEGDIIKLSAESNTQGMIDGTQLGGDQNQFGGSASNFGFGDTLANGSIGFGESVEGFANLSTTPGDLVYGVNNKSIALVDFSQDAEIHPLYETTYPKNKFDIFLHFQNDISHTWLEYLGNNGDISFCRDQTINLEIYPF
jgi:hypothetical protein